MYTNITNILNELPKEVLIDLANDENRPLLSDQNPQGIDLTNLSDPVVIRVNDIINFSDEEINSYLRGKVDLPLTLVPLLITDMSTQISIYRLFRRRRHRILLITTNG